jgi:microcystin-dependent protein
MPFASITLPTGWLACNGQAIDRVIYAALFAIIGETWGPGNGTSTFNVPDFRNRFLIGFGNAGFATRGGADNFTLSTGQLPAHTHTITDPGHDHTTLATASNVTTGTDPGGVTTGGTTGTSTTGITVDSTGSGDPVSYLPPYAAIIFAIKT